MFWLVAIVGLIIGAILSFYGRKTQSWSNENWQNPFEVAVFLAILLGAGSFILEYFTILANT